MIYDPEFDELVPTHVSELCPEHGCALDESEGKTSSGLTFYVLFCNFTDERHVLNVRMEDEEYG